MNSLTLRAATLDDTGTISALFRSRVGVWQRMTEDGRAEDVHYEALTLYERWLHGGPWMSLETSAILLNHLLLGAGMPMVATRRGKIVGYAEAYINNEPPPYDAHVHLANLTLADDNDHETADSLLGFVCDRARKLKCSLVTYNRISDPAVVGACERMVENGAERVSLTSVRRYSMSARTGQIFYRAGDHLNADPLQISGWAMPVGRQTSARHLWETLWTPIFDTLPQTKPRRVDRLKVSSGGTDALVLVHQDLYEQRTADIYAWTPRTLTSQMVTALRDWAHRAGYRTLRLIVGDEVLKALGTDAETDAYTQDTYGLKV